jgi:hypothetical protein
LGLRYVVNLSAGEAHCQRIAQRIDDGVNLGRQSSARAADRFVRTLFSSPGAVLAGSDDGCIDHGVLVLRIVR